jgi:hypothetical protein
MLRNCQLSLVSKDHHREAQPVSFSTPSNPFKALGGVGAVWGGICGLLLVPVVFVLPGVGIVATVGPLASAMGAVLDGALVVGGMSILGAALTQVGVPRDLVPKCEAAVNVDNFVLMVHGNTEDVANARALLTYLKFWRE